MNQKSTIQRFYDLVWPHASTVLRTALFLTRDQSEADDLAQETLFKAFKSLDKFRNDTDMRAWLLKILRNTCIDRIRASAPLKLQVSLEYLDSELADATPDIADYAASSLNPDLILQKFSDEQLIRALRELPEEIRWTLLLVDVEGVDHADAARVLDVPVGTIKSRAHRGREMLRKVLAMKSPGLRAMMRNRADEILQIVPILEQSD